MGNRRAANSSEVSNVSATDSLVELMARELHVASELPRLDLLDNTPLREFGPEQILNRMLSMKSYLSTGSSQAERDQDAHDGLAAKSLRHIGEGQCGTVFALTGTQHVIKIAKDGKIKALWEDYIAHRNIEMALITLPSSQRPDINIPSTRGWIRPGSDDFWNDHAQGLPLGLQKGHGLLSDRIFPLPEPVRDAVFKYFAPPPYKSELARTAQLTEDKNKDCLVRIYLGRRLVRKPSTNFKLRNFDLMINELEDLRLDPELYATTMAQTLAMLHWGVGVDANDVEFVLGSAPEVTLQPLPAELEGMGPDDPRLGTAKVNFKRRRIGLWLLDFNQCSKFKHDETGLKQLVDGFWWNDPYYPRPGSKHRRDARLWNKFKDVYLAASERFIRGISKGLAAQFVLEVEKRSDKQSQQLFG
ncbi:zinc finger protein-domain-containing protein [Xylariales sp. PMI_506]|nr:zinc finger protein-domain-containing protein [Xylariales sp. PMI_506]